jgi:hypothetical protein
LTKQQSQETRDAALKAIAELSRILVINQAQGRAAEFDRLRHAVGSAIGQIERDILAEVYAEHPELDDLR